MDVSIFLEHVFKINKVHCGEAKSGMATHNFIDISSNNKAHVVCHVSSSMGACLQTPVSTNVKPQV